MISSVVTSEVVRFPCYIRNPGRESSKCWWQYSLLGVKLIYVSMVNRSRLCRTYRF